MNALGSALASEYEEQGIIVQTVVPNQVKTKLSRDVHLDAVSVSSEDFVRHALNTVGKERLTSGHPKHKIINNLFILFADLVGEELSMKFKLATGKAARAEYDQKVEKVEK